MERHRAQHLLGTLAALGVSPSIDDFGAGCTSLGQLKNLPVTELKIDKSFVMNLGEDPTTPLIVQSIIDLGHNLGQRIVAEGVETAAAVSDLTGFSCHVAWGYFLSRRVPSPRRRSTPDAPPVHLEPPAPCGKDEYGGPPSRSTATPSCCVTSREPSPSSIPWLRRVCRWRSARK